MKKTIHILLTQLTLCLFLSTGSSFALPTLGDLKVTDAETKLMQKHRLPCAAVWAKYIMSFADSSSHIQKCLHHLAGYALYIERLHTEKHFRQTVESRESRAKDRDPWAFIDFLDGRNLEADFRAILAIMEAYDDLHVDTLIDNAVKSYECYGAHRKKWGYEESVSLVGIGSGTGNY